MLEPLKKFFCDFCNGLISSPEEGYVEWLNELNPELRRRENHGFKIVHHKSYSPNTEGCYHYSNYLGRQDIDLSYFTGSSKMAHIFSLIDVGPYHNPEFDGPIVKNIREFVEFARRLTIPYFEEARKFWPNALEDGYFSGENEVSIYSPDFLKRLIERYCGE